MGEVIPFPGEHERRMESIRQIGLQAVELVTSRYGEDIGNIDVEPEIAALPYHNRQHTLRVRDNARKLAEACGMTSYDAELAVLAASAHDVVHMEPRGVMERKSAMWLTWQMVQQGMPKDDIVAASLAVLGTEPVIRADMMAGQAVDNHEHPTGRVRRIARVVASADMADLYSPQGPLLGAFLFDEQRMLSEKPYFSSPVEALDAYTEFQYRQLELARNYRFPEPRAEELFGKLRPAIVRHHEDIYWRLQTGDISSFRQLHKEIAEFCIRHTED